jgi:arylsulfatase A-like enzyme
LVEKDTSFENAIVTDPVCCPSRATALRGQYTHNHQIKGTKPPAGGWEKFRDLGLGESTVATWLQEAGYSTAHIGKYLNGYLNTTYVPPGWDEWHASNGGGYYDFTLNENGENVFYEGRRNYQTDVLNEKAVDFINKSGGEESPFFMQFTPWAPHGPVDPAPRHEDLFTDEELPMPPSFGEADVSDKPAWVQEEPRIDEAEVAELTEWHQDRLRTLAAVDEGVRDVVNALQETGQLENTYIFFTSDNGYMMGEHRLSKTKAMAYEEAINMPLIVRGPGVPEGRTVDHLALNTDFAPTFAELGGASIPGFVDGRSLTPLLREDPPPKADWRHSVLVYNKNNLSINLPEYWAVRMEEWSYIRYSTGEEELYNLQEDPFQLESVHETVDRQFLRNLRRQSRQLSRCAADTCRAFEDRELTP